MKSTSMKRAFVLFWHGFTAILASIANWFTTILGLKDDSKYGKFIRRVVGSSFAVIMVMLTAAVVFVMRSMRNSLGSTELKNVFMIP